VTGTPPPGPPWAPPRDRFFGRVVESGQLDVALHSEGALVTLIGPGGAGKSRLAREYLSRLTSTRRPPPGGLLFVALEALRDGPGLDAALASALHVREGGGESGARLGQALAARGETLLVLDDAEHLLPTLAGRVDELLRAAPAARVLVTSRARLGIPGEQLIEVGPLADRGDAAALLLDRAGRLRPGFEPTEPDRDAAAAIADLLDSIPLALELAAGRSGVLGLEPLRRRLERDGRIDLLSGGPGGSGGRHRGLELTIAGSWDLLEEPTRRVLAGCSVFVDHFDAEAAEAVLRPLAPGLLDHLQLLLDRSLLRAMPTSGAVRFRLLGAVREFAGRRLAELGQADRIAASHRSWYARRAAEVAEQVRGPAPGPALAWLRRERAHLVAVVAGGEPEQGLDAAVALGALLLREGPLPQLLDLLDQALRPAGPADATEARRLRARVLALLGRHDEARQELDRVAAGDAGSRGRTQLTAAELAQARGRVREARDRARDACASLERDGSPADRAEAMALLARLHWQRGRRDEATALARAALSEARQGGAALLEAEIAAWCGRAEAMAGRASAARELLEPAAARFAEVGDLRARIDVLRALGRCELALGSLDAARRCFDESVTLSRTVGAAGDETQARMDLAELAMADDQHPAAEQQLQAALEAAGRAGDARQQARARLDLALLAWAAGRPGQARDQVRLATVDAERSTDSWGRVEAAALTGALLAIDGRHEEAEQAFDRADELTMGTTVATVPARVVVLRAMLRQAGDAGAAEDLHQASRLAPADFGEVGRTGRVADPRLHLLIEPLRRAMPEPAWSSAWARVVDPDDSRLVLPCSGRFFRPPGAAPIDLGEGSQLARLLGALIEARLERRPLDPDEIRERLWPGERMAFQSALDRVYQAVRRLRKAGIDAWLERSADGYLLRGEVALIP
jgi:predicted ATPase